MHQKTPDGNLKTSWNTFPLRITDFVLTPDGRRLIAITIMSNQRKDNHGAVKPAASRSTEGAASYPPTDPAASKYPLPNMDRHIVIYNIDSGKIQA
jgi:hypothetical protein